MLLRVSVLLCHFTLRLMNIVIDNGNSLTKVGIFERGTLTGKKVFAHLNDLHEFLRNTKAEFALVSSVRSSREEISNWPIVAKQVFFLDRSLPLPIKNLYATPHTLGVDRLAAACGAHTLYPNTDCLVIDAGTCINYEFVNKKGEYLGGAISPGIRMRFDAMHQGTARLPIAVPRLGPLINELSPFPRYTSATPILERVAKSDLPSPLKSPTAIELAPTF